MFAKIKNNEFVGFFNEKIEDDTCNFIEIEEVEYLEIIENQNSNTRINIENNKLKLINLNEFEFVENNEIKFDKQGKIEKIKKDLFNIRLEYDVAPFEFEVDGEIYLQNNRSIDQSNLTRIVVMCQAMKKTSFENWKFYTKNNSEKYINLSLQKMMEMALIMQNQTTKSMATETLLSHKLETLTDEELKEFNARIEFEKAFKEMVEVTEVTENNDILGG